MVATIQVPVTEGKTVALVLTQGIQAWIETQAASRGISKSKVAREVFEKAMRDSEEKEVA